MLNAEFLTCNIFFYLTLYTLVLVKNEMKSCKSIQILQNTTNFDSNPKFVFVTSQESIMNGEVPSVPITTLAGVSSLSDCKYSTYIYIYV